MKKVFVGILDCVSGMKMAESLYNEYGAVIVGKDTILDAHIIRKLTNLGINRVSIYDQSENLVTANSTELFKAQYGQNIQTIRGILEDMSNGKNIDLKKIEATTDSIVVRINENRDIVSCITQIKSSNEYTYTHSVNVAFLCMLIGKWMKYGPDKIKKLVQAGLLHDIGKIMVPPEILNKPGKLTDKEYEEIKKHSVYGYRIIEKLPDIERDIGIAVLMHHEREDGSGYPVGLKGEKIHEYSKVIAVADTYDAMTSNRVYRERESPFDAFDEMKNNTFGTLDTKVLNAFLSNIAAYYIGDFVRLSTGEKAEIIYINPSDISRPIVKAGDKFIDLVFNPKIKVVELL